MKKQPLKNFIVFNLDGSGSMQQRRQGVIDLFNNQVEFLVKRSKELEQETRAFVYVFGEDVQNLVWDMDVLRLPNIEELYHPDGRTALVDSTIQSIDDLKKIPQIYCDFSVLHFTISDGLNNVSNHRIPQLRAKIGDLADNWTMAYLAPDAQAVSQARTFGFENIQRWDVSAKGIQEMGQTMQRVTESYMVGRAQGVRGSRTGLFTLNTEALKPQAVQAALEELTKAQYHSVIVTTDGVTIRDYAETLFRSPYVKGSGYYQLTKREEVQANKSILVRAKRTAQVFGGRNARALIGLPDHEVKVSPDHNPDFDIFIQSNSTTRKLVRGTTLLLLR